MNELKEFGTVNCKNFVDVYPKLNDFILKYGKHQKSRNDSETYEVLDFSTKIENPLFRCVGTKERDINIFFLLAEAMWIWSGRKDVKFLEMFLPRMKEFSDDGEVFHASYGHRLRHYEYGYGHGIDQIRELITLLSKEPDTRRAVASIWNVDLDLNVDSKDIPCNDMLMYKLRDNKLNLTIANRSNDLHWGLPTNLFQFSFITEIISKILGVEQGRQVHNSQSLHIYTNNPSNSIHKRMSDSVNGFNVYDFCQPTEMDFECETTLQSFDNEISIVLNNIENGDFGNISSKYFSFVAELLQIYLQYRKTKKTQNDKFEALHHIFNDFNDHGKICEDYMLLAANWFIKRLDDEHKERFFNNLPPDYIRNAPTTLVKNLGKF